MPSNAQALKNLFAQQNYKIKKAHYFDYSSSSINYYEEFQYLTDIDQSVEDLSRSIRALNLSIRDIKDIYYSPEMPTLLHYLLTKQLFVIPYHKNKNNILISKQDELDYFEPITFLDETKSYTFKTKCKNFYTRLVASSNEKNNKHNLTDSRAARYQKLNLILEACLPKSTDQEFYELISTTNKRGETALHLAFNYPGMRYDLLSPLFKRTKELSRDFQEKLLSITDQNGNLFLHNHVQWTSTPEELRQVLQIFDKGILKPALLYKNNFGKTPIHYACEQGSLLKLDACCKLLNEGEKTKQENASLAALFANAAQDGNNVLHYCIKNTGNAFELLKKIIEFLPAEESKEEPGCSQQSSLHVAFKIGTQKINSDGYTPLMLSASKNDIDSVSLLLKYMGDEAEQSHNIAIRNSAGMTALHYACQTGSPAVIKKLIETLSPADLHKIIHSKPDILPILEKSGIITVDYWNQLLKSKIAVFNIVNYLEKRANKYFLSKQDYLDRENHFINFLHRKIDREAPEERKESKNLNDMSPFRKGFFTHNYANVYLSSHESINVEQLKNLKTFAKNASRTSLTARIHALYEPKDSLKQMVKFLEGFSKQARRNYFFNTYATFIACLNHFVLCLTRRLEEATDFPALPRCSQFGQYGDYYRSLEFIPAEVILGYLEEPNDGTKNEVGTALDQLKAKFSRPPAMAPVY